MDQNIYFFNGWYTSFNQCYGDLVKNGVIQNRISDGTLMFIKDFEDNLNCAGFCEKPDFWFYKDYFVGPP